MAKKTQSQIEADILDSMNVGSSKDVLKNKPESHVTRLMFKWGDSIVNRLKDNLNKKGKNASNRLSQSIDFNVDYFGFMLTFTLNLEDYYKWVDKGRKGGKVPKDFEKKILEWIGEKEAVQTKIPKEDRKRFAYLVARKIRLKGYKGSNFYSSVVNKKELSVLKKDIEIALKKDVELDIIKTFR